MTPHPRPRRSRRSPGRARTLAALGLLMTLIAAAAAASPAAHALAYTRISGNGSSWAGNAIIQWTTEVKAQNVTVDYTPDGSSSGRKNFVNGLADFAVSEIPFSGDTSDPQDDIAPTFAYGLLPVVAGGTSFMYNLPVNGGRYEQLNLSQAALAKIFSGQVTTWNDPIIAATNPGVALPAQQITVVVRSDGSGATAQFTLWMLRQFPGDWAALCAKTNCNPNAATSYFPYQGLANFQAQAGSNGVTTYTANTEYTINYDEYSYALGVGFPVVNLQNSAGFYTKPTDTAVAVALTQAIINQDQGSPNYLSQNLSNVYAYGDPRTYPISAYSYLVVPAATRGTFDAAKGATLGFFASYALCEGQQTMGALGYSPLPMNLVLDAMGQVRRIPGVDAATTTLLDNTRDGAATGNSNPCNNPTFQPGDDVKHNVLIDTAPFPDGCDAACQAPWLTREAATGGKTGKGNKGGNQGGDGSSAQGDPTAVPTDSTATTGAAPVSTPTDAAAVVPGALAASTACDPDTGVCGGGTAVVGTSTATDSVALAATPAVIDGDKPWGGAQLALFIAILGGLALLVAPPLISRVIERRPPSGGGSGGGR